MALEVFPGEKPKEKQKIPKDPGAVTYTLKGKATYKEAPDADRK